MFSVLFKIILIGDKKSSRKAARLVRRLVYSNSSRKDYEELARTVENAPETYQKIKEDFRQENFVIAISVMYFLHNKRDKPDFLFPWLLELIQHKNGYIRHAAVRMLENELGPLTYHIRCADYAPNHYGVAARQADQIIFTLFVNLSNLAANLREPKYKKYKYINSLPASPYKSIQMVLSHICDDCGEEYLRHFNGIVGR